MTTTCRFCPFPVPAVEAVHVGFDTAHPDCAERFWDYAHGFTCTDRKDAS